MAAFYSGEYKSITITLLNSDGTDYDVTTATGIACIIYEQPEREIARYSLVAATGYDVLTIQNTNEILLAMNIFSDHFRLPTGDANHKAQTSHFKGSEPCAIDGLQPLPNGCN